MEATGSPTASAQDPEVFIVDSDERACEELRLITEACGYKVQAFNDGHPALEKLRNSEPRLLIVELLLPVLDGFELCQAVRSDLGYNDLPILCMTGISWGSVDLSELLQRRFRARFLAKGMMVEKFLATLQIMMQTPVADTGPAVRAVLESRKGVVGKQEPVEISNLQLQAETVVRAVMSDKLDQGEAEETIREQTDSVVQAVLEYRKHLDKVQLSAEYHYAKPVNLECAQPQEGPPQPPAPETGENDALVIGKMSTIRLGESGVRRTRDLTLEFQREIANVETSKQRQDVRVRKAIEVRVEDIDSLDPEYTENISAGGLFIRSGRPPDKGTVITLSIKLPNQSRMVEAQARVIHSILPEQAKVMGRNPGCGVEFVNLSAEDQKLLKKLIDEEYTQPSDSIAEGAGDLKWVVLLGLPVLPMVGRPNFLLRNNIRMAEFPNLPAAREFLGGRQIALVIIGESAFEGTSADEFRLEFKKVVPAGTQNLYLDSNQTMKSVLDEISRRLNLRSRASPRVPFQASVTMHQTIDEVLAPEEFSAQMINLSCTGMLLCTDISVPIGTILHLIFGLPDNLEIRCRAVVVRRRQEQESEVYFYGVAFNEFFGDAENRLESFVQSQINFREFFRWMKKRYFEYP